MTTALATIRNVVVEAHVTQPVADRLMEVFEPFFQKARSIITNSEKVNVTDATQLTEMKQARDLRLALKEIRVEAEKKRKEMKEEYLRTGKAIDGAYGIIRDLIAPAEERLLQLEEFAIRAEADRKRALGDARRALLAPYGTDTRFIDLENMDTATFSVLHEQAALAHQKKIDDAKAAEEARKAKEAAEAAERARVAAENERLKQEAEAREAEHRKERERLAAEARAQAEKAKAEQEAAHKKAQEERKAAEAKAQRERAEAEAKLKAERERREALERQERERKQAEERKRKEEEKARRRAAAAPDVVKLREFAKQLRGIPFPVMATDDGTAVAARISDILGPAILAIEREIQTLA